MQELIWIAGPLLLAVLLAVGGRQLPLVACGVLSIAGTVVYTLGLRAAPDVPGTRVTAASPLRQARVRVLLACCACYGVSVGMLNLALVAFAGAHGGVAWAGVLVAIWGTGSLALLMVGLGIPLSPWLGSLSASVQRVVPAAAATEAFAWSFAAITVGMAVGSAISGVVIQTAGTPAAFVSAGALSLAAALFGASRVR